MLALKLATSLVLGIVISYSGLSYITENTNGLSLGDVRVFVTTQGGTGTSSPSGILYGDGTSALKTVTIGSNLTFSGGTLSSTGGGGGGGAFPFSAATHYGKLVYATNTPTIWLQDGVIASSTSYLQNSTTSLATIGTAWITNVFIGADTLAEYISDTAGAAFTGNTETGITVTYQDADNTVDFVVSNLQDLAGTLDVGSGGTGLTTFGGSNHVLYTTAADTLASEAGFEYDAGGNIFVAPTVRASANFSAAAGDITTPGFYFTSDTNTGIYRVAADQLGISAGASLSASFQATGASTTRLSVFQEAKFGATATTSIDNAGNLTVAGNLSGAGLSTCQGGNFLTWAGGQFGCGADQAGSGGGASQFTSATYGGSFASATTTPVWFQATSPKSFYASSTYTNFATSSQFTLGSWSSTSNVGIYFTQDGDGALTVQGIGNNANEDLTFNFDDVSNTVDVTSSTGVSNFDFNTLSVTAGSILANANDGGALGASGTAWSDLFLASGGIINWAAGDVTLTHGSGLLTLSASDGFTMSGAFINESGSLEIPNSATCTVDATGEICVDSNFASEPSSDTNQLLVATSTNASFPAVIPLSFTIPTHYSSTTWTGTTTLYYGGGALHPFTLRSVYCRSNTGTALIRIGDGTNWTNAVSISSTNASTTLTTNNSFTYGEDVDIQIGTPASGVAVVGCTFKGFYDRI